MKNIFTYIIAISFLSVGSCFSQQLITTAGMQENNVSWSIGELVNEAGSTGDATIYQGFNMQSDDIFSAVPTFFNQDFKFYPNPVLDKLYLNLTTKIDSWRITDIVGRVLMSNNSCIDQQIDMSALKSGQYILKIMADGYNKSIIVIKN